MLVYFAGFCVFNGTARALCTDYSKIRQVVYPIESMSRGLSERENVFVSHIFDAYRESASKFLEGELSRG